VPPFCFWCLKIKCGGVGCPSKDLVIKNDQKKSLEQIRAQESFTYSAITKQGYPLFSFMYVFCPIIRIDENLKPAHLQRNHSVLSMWPGSTQKLGLRINNNGNRSSRSSNHRKFVGAVVGMTNSLCVCGHWSFWTLVTRKHGSTLGISFLAWLSGRRGSFILLLSTTTMVLEGSMSANIGFLGHLSPGAMCAGFLRSLLLGKKQAMHHMLDDNIKKKDIGRNNTSPEENALEFT